MHGRGVCRKQSHTLPRGAQRTDKRQQTQVTAGKVFSEINEAQKQGPGKAAQSSSIENLKMLKLALLGAGSGT